MASVPGGCLYRRDNDGKGQVVPGSPICVLSPFLLSSHWLTGEVLLKMTVVAASAHPHPQRHPQAGTRSHRNGRRESVVGQGRHLKPGRASAEKRYLACQAASGEGNRWG